VQSFFLTKISKVNSSLNSEYKGSRLVTFNAILL